MGTPSGVASMKTHHKKYHICFDCIDMFLRGHHIASILSTSILSTLLMKNPGMYSMFLLSYTGELKKKSVLYLLFYSMELKPDM